MAIDSSAKQNIGVAAPQSVGACGFIGDQGYYL